jgi:hypothetical protein
VWWPAAARKRLSGEMQRRLTCESGCWMVREQMPERASQNLVRRRGPRSQRRRLRFCSVLGVWMGMDGVGGGQRRRSTGQRQQWPTLWCGRSPLREEAHRQLVKRFGQGVPKHSFARKMTIAPVRGSRTCTKNHRHDFTWATARSLSTHGRVRRMRCGGRLYLNERMAFKPTRIVLREANGAAECLQWWLNS